MNLMPLARTPMDEKSGRAMKDYSKKVTRTLDQMVPWQENARRKASLHRKVKPGTVVVMLDEGESSNMPLFKDAKITKER